MFTQEELIAIRELIKYANKDVGTEDEPLLPILFEKLESLIEKKE